MKFYSKVLLAVSAFALGACSSSSNNNGGNVFPLPDTGIIEVVHAVSDAPSVNVLVNGEVALSDVDYGDASGSIVFEVGTYNISVEANLPGGATAEVIPSTPVTVAVDTVTTVIATGSVAAGNIAPTPFVNPRAPVTGGTARVFVVHGVNADLPVNVYAVAPGTDITTVAPLNAAPINFGETIGPAEVAAGDYDVIITDAMGGILFDSGTLTLADGNDFRLIAAPNVSGGPAAITLLAATGSGGASSIFDENVGTALRVGHLSPDTPAVDVLVNDAEYLTDVVYPQITGFDPLPADTYNVAVTPADMPTMPAIGPVDLELAAGTWYSVLAINTFAEIEPLILTDDPRPVATNAKVRIVHAAPTAGLVDIYLTAPGAGIADVDPTLAGVDFRANTGYLPLAAGDYDVTVTATTTKDIAIGPATISIEDGGVYTAIARDPGPMEMNFGLEVLVDVIDD